MENQRSRPDLLLVGLTCICGALALFLGGCRTKKEIRVVGDRSFFPFEFCSAKGEEASGILPEQWRLMGRQANIRIRYTCDDWAAAQDAVLNGKADALGGMIRSAIREEKFAFIKPLIQNPPEFFYFDQNKYSGQPELANLIKQNEPVGVVKGDYGEIWLQEHYPQVNLKPYPSYDKVVQGALNGEISIFVMEESIASHHLDQFGVTQRYSRSGSSLFHEWLWATVRKDNFYLAQDLRADFARVSEKDLANVAEHWRESNGFVAWVKYGIMPLVEEHPVNAALAVFVVVYLVVIGILYIFFPLSIYRLSARLRQLDVSFSLAGIPTTFPVRLVFVITFFDKAARVLDAFIANRREVITRNFHERKTVKDRSEHYVLPFAIDTEVVDGGGEQERQRELAIRLKELFERYFPCLVIRGEGGSGKTSLACWIARQALQADPRQQSIFKNFTLPVMMEGQLEAGLLEAIHGQLNALIEEEIPKDIVLALLKANRALIIIDGVSEMSGEGRKIVSTLSPSIPRFPLIVTSRHDQTILGGIALKELRPRKLSGPALAAFLDFLLQKRGVRDKFNDPLFFSSCEHLTRLVGQSEVSPLLVVLYRDVVVSSAALASGSLPDLKAIPDLLWSYVAYINKAVSENRHEDAVVLQALRIVAWLSMSEEYHPEPRLRSDVLKTLKEAFESPDDDLTYLEEKLALIESVNPAQSYIRFVLDPLAEYLAAAYLLAEGFRNHTEWRKFFDFVSGDTMNLSRCLGFARALVDIYSSSARGITTASIPEYDGAMADLKANIARLDPAGLPKHMTFHS